MYTNVTTIKSTICSPSANISSEAERGSVSTPNRRRWYTATRISFPSASITSYNDVVWKSKECDDTRTHLRNPPTHLPLILLPIRRCESSIPSLHVNTHTHCTISLRGGGGILPPKRPPKARHRKILTRNDLPTPIPYPT